MSDDPVIYSRTGEQPDDPDGELEVNTLADGTVIVSTGELDGQVAEVAAVAWRRQCEEVERQRDEARAEVARLRNVIDVRRDDGTWTVAVTVPMRLPDEEKSALFTAVADAAHEWEPDDRDGWDISVTGYCAERDDLEAEVERMRTALEEIKLRTVQRDLNRLAAAALQPRPEGARHG